MARQRFFPMPIEPIYNCPALASANGAVYRATLALTIAFWAGGCRPLPKDEASLASLARLGLGNWKAIKEPVLQALSELLPDYIKPHAKEAKRRSHLSRAGILSMAVQRAKRGQQMQTTPPSLNDTKPTTTPHKPYKSPVYQGNGKAELPAVAKRMANSRNGQAFLSDAR